MKITGKQELSGEVEVSGSKNAALPCLAAGLLLKLDQQIDLFNMPRIRDVNVFIEILKTLGLEINWLDKNRLTIKRVVDIPQSLSSVKISPEEARKLRASILLVGPLLRIYDKVLMPQPGGCKIGPRPIDIHLEAFQQLGIKISRAGEFYCLEKDRGWDSGEFELLLSEASVTATENILLFTAGNRGSDLIIKNAASEPHVQTLCFMLEVMGANFSGEASNRLTVFAGELEHNSSGLLGIQVEPDYIEALTFAVAAAVTKSDIKIKDVELDDLVLIKRVLNKMGVVSTLDADKKDHCFKWRIMGGSCNLNSDSPVLIKELKAEPWPGLPTDALPLFLVLATQCECEIEFVDYMYNGRLINLANALNNMGADIKILGNRGLLVKGPTPLKARTQLSPDLRNGVGLVLAALCAEGESVIQNFEIVERGYENLPEKLLKLGAKIEKI